MKNRWYVYGGLCLLVTAGLWATPSEARERGFNRADVEKNLAEAGVEVDDGQSKEDRLEALRDQHDMEDDGRSAESDQRAAADTKIPPGTRVMMALDETLDSAENGAGEQFTGKLKTKLIVDGYTLAPSGSKLYGKIITSTRARNALGTSVLEFKLTGLMIDNQLRSIDSNLIRVESDKSGRMQANASMEAGKELEFTIGEAGSDMSRYKTQTIAGPDTKAPDRVEERRGTRKGRRGR